MKRFIWILPLMSLIYFRVALAEVGLTGYDLNTHVTDTILTPLNPWMNEGDFFSEVSLMGHYGVVVLGKENFPDDRTFFVRSALSFNYMVTERIGIGVGFEGNISSYYTNLISQDMMYDKLSISSRMWTGEIFYGTQIEKSWITTGYPSYLYAGLGVGRRIDTTLIVDVQNYSSYNQLYSYQYFVGFLKPISKHIAVGTRFERRMFSEPFEVDGFTKALLLDDEALNTWRRDVLLRFTFVYKW